MPIRLITTTLSTYIHLTVNSLFQVAPSFQKLSPALRLGELDGGQPPRRCPPYAHLEANINHSLHTIQDVACSSLMAWNRLSRDDCLPTSKPTHVWFIVELSLDLTGTLHSSCKSQTSTPRGGLVSARRCHDTPTSLFYSILSFLAAVGCIYPDPQKVMRQGTHGKL